MDLVIETLAKRRRGGWAWVGAVGGVGWGASPPTLTHPQPLPNPQGPAAKRRTGGFRIPEDLVEPIWRLAKRVTFKIITPGKGFLTHEQQMQVGAALKGLTAISLAC